jgi:hypothetical protein
MFVTTLWCQGTVFERTVTVKVLVFEDNSTWGCLLGMPIINDHQLYLFPCAYFGAVLMLPDLHTMDVSQLKSLDPSDLGSHLGRIALLPATMVSNRSSRSYHVRTQESVFDMDEPEQVFMLQALDMDQPAAAFQVPVVSQPSRFSTELTNSLPGVKPAGLKPAATAHVVEVCEDARAIQLEQDRVAMHGMPMFRALPESLQDLDDPIQPMQHGVPIQPMPQPVGVLTAISSLAFQLEQRYTLGSGVTATYHAAADKFWHIAMSAYSRCNSQQSSHAAGAVLLSELELKKLHDF